MPKRSIRKRLFFDTLLLHSGFKAMRRHQRDRRDCRTCAAKIQLYEMRASVVDRRAGDLLDYLTEENDGDAGSKVQASRDRYIEGYDHPDVGETQNQRCDDAHGIRR